MTGPLPARYRAAHIVRHRFSDAVRGAHADQATIFAGLVLGDTSAVTALTSREFRAARLARRRSRGYVTIVCGAGFRHG